MKNDQVLIKKLNASLKKQAAIPNLGRWLTELDNEDVLGLALLALENEPTPAMKKLVRVFMSAEGLYRARANNEDKYIHRLGWHAMAEHAYRMDWMLISANPTLTRDGRESSSLTPLGELMISAMGPSSRVAGLLQNWSKTGHFN